MSELTTILEQLESYKSKYDSAQQKLATQTETMSRLAQDNEELKEKAQKCQNVEQELEKLKQEFAEYKVQMRYINDRNEQLLHKEHVLNCVTSSASYRLTRKLVELVKKFPLASKIKKIAQLIKSRI
ncbi:MAG: hypothetical protein IT292_04015 [Deltaproteobacteria bacterium]|nr:hypothetical protein [Deltaproteobacteria bacterium]